MEARVNMMHASSTLERKNMRDEQDKKHFEKVSKTMERIDKRLEAAIDRVQKLSDRVAERLTKLEARGVNVAISREHLMEANTKLNEARAKEATVKLLMQTAIVSTATSTDLKNPMKDVHAAAREVRKIIQEAHRHVSLAISTAKSKLPKPTPATTTAEMTKATTTP